MTEMLHEMKSKPFREMFREIVDLVVADVGDNSVVIGPLLKPPIDQPDQLNYFMIPTGAGADRVFSLRSNLNR